MRLAEKPKSFVISVGLKGYWPPSYDQVWNYTTLAQAKKHINWLFEQIAAQQGKDAVRKHVILGYTLYVVLRSIKRDKRFVPLKRFVRPKAGELPEGGKKLFGGTTID